MGTAFLRNFSNHSVKKPRQVQNQNPTSYTYYALLFLQTADIH